MKNQKAIINLNFMYMKTQDNNLQYVGSYNTLKVGKESKTKDVPRYNEKQNELYGRSLIGLRYYNEDVLKQMHEMKRKKIEYMHKKAQYEINLYKQEVMLSKSAKIADVFIKKCNGSKGILNQTITNLFKTPIKPDPNFICNLKFKDLDIKKENLINLLISKKILPSNFYAL